MTRNRIAIGARRLRVTLLEPVETDDGIGGTLRTWQPRIALWAKVEPDTGGREVLDADRPEMAARYRFTLRWRADVTAGMRFVAGERSFNILATQDTGTPRRNLVCRVEEIRP